MDWWQVGLIFFGIWILNDRISQLEAVVRRTNALLEEPHNTPAESREHETGSPQIEFADKLSNLVAQSVGSRTEAQESERERKEVEAAASQPDRSSALQCAHCKEPIPAADDFCGMCGKEKATPPNPNGRIGGEDSEGAP